MRTFSRGKQIHRVKRSGNDLRAVIRRGQAAYIWNDNGLGIDGLIPTTTRIVTDDGQKWLELGFDMSDEIAITGSPETWWDAEGYAYLYLEWRRNLTQWEMGKFIESPTGNESLPNDVTRVWCRAINPLTASTATAPEMVCESTAETGDSRSNPFTGIKVGGVAVSLPNAPYEMPGDAAQLQTDLRAAGHTTATVAATSDVDWRIVLEDLTFTTNQSVRVEFTDYLHHIVESNGFAMWRNYLEFTGDILDANGKVIAPDGFGRLCVQQGTRYGNAVLMVPQHPDQVDPLVDDPYRGFYPGVGSAYDPLTGVPRPTYPISGITGASAPGATLTRPTVVWEDPGWSSLVIVGTWYKDGVATSAHGATYVATEDGTYSYREVATNENGDSVVNDLSWPSHTISQALVDAGLDDPKWLTPYAALADGTENTLIRFLDDPDVPCYQGTWMKSDKNRFHQARGPGGPKKYVLNPDLWCYAFRDSLSGVSVANDQYSPVGVVPNENWMTKAGGFLLTNQHIGTCAHGPLGYLNYPGFPLRIRFLGTDGETYERRVVGKKSCHSGDKVGVSGVLHGGDFWIGTLDSPLPPEVHVLRIIPHNFKRFFTSGNSYDRLFVSQSMENESNSAADAAAKYHYYPFNQPDYSPALYHPNYPSRQRTMCVGWTGYPDLKYWTWAGDSGQPAFLAAGTELLWAGFSGGGGSGPDLYPVMQDGVSIVFEDLANQMIADSDAAAITAGGLVSATGKTVTVFEL